MVARVCLPLGRRNRYDQVFAPPFVTLNTRPTHRRSAYSLRPEAGGEMLRKNPSVRTRLPPSSCAVVLPIGASFLAQPIQFGTGPGVSEDARDLRKAPLGQ